MPCDSSHMEADAWERESAKVRRYLREVGIEPVTASGQWSSDEYYGNVESLDEDTRRLCTWCTEHTDLVGQKSLELQIWWRDHQAADRAKEAKRVQHALKKQIRERALAKLTPDERKVLGL